MIEIIKILILGGCFLAFVAASYNVAVGEREAIKEELLKAYGFQKEGNWWRKIGYSINDGIVKEWSIKRLMLYLERCAG